MTQSRSAHCSSGLPALFFVQQKFANTNLDSPTASAKAKGLPRPVGAGPTLRIVPFFFSSVANVAAHAGCIPTAEAELGAGIAGWNLRYSANEIAPKPHRTTPNHTHIPIFGTATISRISTYPNAMRPIRGHVSRVGPRIHFPRMPPTTSCEQKSVPNHRRKVEMPSARPTTVKQATHAAIGTAKNTRTPNPSDMPKLSPAATESAANLGMSRNRSEER